MKTVIDPYSNAFFQANLKNIKDVLTRGLIWKSFFDNVKDGVSSSLKFIDTVVQNLSSETSDAIYEKQLTNAHLSISVYTPIKHRENLKDKMFTFIRSEMGRVTEDQQNRKVILADRLFDYASSE